MPEITFAIPYYQGNNPSLSRELLSKAIKSVLSQSISDWKLIICHNGGADVSLDELINTFCDSRIKLINNGINIGGTGNFNACIDRAQTPLVTLLHSDDMLLPNYAECLLKAASAYREATLFYCKTKIIDESDRPKFSIPDFIKRFTQPKEIGPYTRLKGEEAVSRLLKGNFIFCPTICFRKLKLGENRFSESWKSVQDFELITRLLLEGHTFIGVNEVAYAYRRHSNNHTVEYRQNLTLFREEIRIFNYLANLCQKAKWYRAEKIAKNKVIIRLNLLYCALIDILNGHFKNSTSKIGLVINMEKNLA